MLKDLEYQAGDDLKTYNESIEEDSRSEKTINIDESREQPDRSRRKTSQVVNIAILR